VKVVEISEAEFCSATAGLDHRAGSYWSSLAVETLRICRFDHLCGSDVDGFLAWVFCRARVGEYPADLINRKYRSMFLSANGIT
jgi:hypothetical protein